MLKIMLMTKMVSIVSKVATVDVLNAISYYLHFKDTEFEGYRDQEYFSRAEIRKSRLKADIFNKGLVAPSSQSFH